MQIKYTADYTADAFASLTGLINFIESRNTSGAGIRWLSYNENFLKKAFINPEKKKLCGNDTLKKLKLRCIYFTDRVIAFSINKNFILIEAILHKSRIID